MNHRWRSSVKPHTYVTIAEAAQQLEWNPRTVRRRISEGALPAYRLGPRHIRIKVSDIDAMLRPIPTAGGDDAV